MSFHNTVLSFLKIKGIDPNEIDISFSSHSRTCKIELWKSTLEYSPSSKEEKARLLRNLKRAFGPLEVRGDETWKYLYGEYIFNDASRIEFSYKGSYECQIVNTTTQEVELTESQREWKKKQAEKLLREAEAGFEEKTKNSYICKETSNF